MNAPTPIVNAELKARLRRAKLGKLLHTLPQRLALAKANRLAHAESLKFALGVADPIDTAQIYELVVERHQTAATVVTSNREPVEWLALMADPLLAQSAIDRLQSAAYELVLEGDSYRRRQKPVITNDHNGA